MVPGTCATSGWPPPCVLAIEVHAHRLRPRYRRDGRRTHGLDALVFTGGIGEHQAETRVEATAGLASSA